MRSTQFIKLVVAALLGLLVGVMLGSAVLGGMRGVVIGAFLGPPIGIGFITVVAAPAPPLNWQRWAARLAGIGFVILSIAAVYGLVAGVVTVLLWQPGMRWHDLLLQIQDTAYMLAILLGLPSLFVGAWYIVRRQRGKGLMWLLPFLGPLIVLVVGQGLTPHLESRWHQFVHTISGSLPLALLYGIALRKWHPSRISF